tara:strand:+ start:202 stop:795 length:594 start_codon:yes stop_codon:yes gene_type:complete
MALKTDNKIFLSWADVDDAVNKLCDKIRFDQINIDSVHGIARGGLIPAVLISHKLGLPYVGLVGPNTLVVDDICDSGVTLDKGPGVYTAVLHYKPHTSCFQPTMWSEIHEGNEWLIYPWETKDSLPIQDYLANDAKKERDALEEYYKSDEFLEFAEGEDNSVEWSEEDSKLHTIGGLTNDKEGSFMKFQNKLNNKNK